MIIPQARPLAPCCRTHRRKSATTRARPCLGLAPSTIVSPNHGPLAFPFVIGPRGAAPENSRPHMTTRPSTPFDAPLVMGLPKSNSQSNRQPPKGFLYAPWFAQAPPLTAPPLPLALRNSAPYFPLAWANWMFCRRGHLPKPFFPRGFPI